MNLTELNIYTLLFYSTGFFFVVQLFYIFFYFFRIAFHKQKTVTDGNFPPVSVVIAARSEAHNLVEFLPFIFEQDYPDFEVVVVNDRSWDDTKEILKAFQIKYANLHVVTIDDGNHRSPGKKMAITLGIKGAKNEHILVTDADCRPVSKNWIKQMVAGFQNPNADMILGYSPFKMEKGFLNTLIRFDGFWVALQYLSFAKAGNAYMGVGRNMAYKKELFFKVGGFRKHYHLQSGDDDLFVNETANRKNVAVAISPDSHVETLPKLKWDQWVFQKRRHFTTSPFYRFKHRFLLGLFPFSLVMFYILAISLMVLNKFLLINLILIVVRSLLLIVTFTRAGKWLGNKDLGWKALFLETIFLFIYPIIYFTGKKEAKQRWN